MQLERGRACDDWFNEDLLDSIDNYHEAAEATIKQQAEEITSLKDQVETYIKVTEDDEDTINELRADKGKQAAEIERLRGIEKEHEDHMYFKHGLGSNQL